LPPPLPAPTLGIRQINYLDPEGNPVFISTEQPGKVLFALNYPWGSNVYTEEGRDAQATARYRLQQVLPFIPGISDIKKGDLTQRPSREIKADVDYPRKWSAWDTFITSRLPGIFLPLIVGFTLATTLFYAFITKPWRKRREQQFLTFKGGERVNLQRLQRVAVEQGEGQAAQVLRDRIPYFRFNRRAAQELADFLVAEYLRTNQAYDIGVGHLRLVRGVPEELAAYFFDGGDAADTPLLEQVAASPEGHDAAESLERLKDDLADTMRYEYEISDDYTQEWYQRALWELERATGATADDILARAKALAARERVQINAAVGRYEAAMQNWDEHKAIEELPWLVEHMAAEVEKVRRGQVQAQSLSAYADIIEGYVSRNQARLAAAAGVLGVAQEAGSIRVVIEQAIADLRSGGDIRSLLRQLAQRKAQIRAIMQNSPRMRELSRRTFLQPRPAAARLWGGSLGAGLLIGGGLFLALQAIGMADLGVLGGSVVGVGVSAILVSWHFYRGPSRDAEVGGVLAYHDLMLEVKKSSLWYWLVDRAGKEVLRSDLLDARGMAEHRLSRWLRTTLRPKAAGLAYFGTMGGSMMLLTVLSIVMLNRGFIEPLDLAIATPFFLWLSRNTGQVLADSLIGRFIKRPPAPGVDLEKIRLLQAEHPGQALLFNDVGRTATGDDVPILPDALRQQRLEDLPYRAGRVTYWVNYEDKEDKVPSLEELRKNISYAITAVDETMDNFVRNTLDHLDPDGKYVNLFLSNSIQSKNRAQKEDYGLHQDEIEQQARQIFGDEFANRYGRYLYRTRPTAEGWKDWAFDVQLYELVKFMEARERILAEVRQREGFGEKYVQDHGKH
ncbi:MAG: hypothetical protein Q8R78_05625, partial [Candidatus Omnitrophota bacterium]|nr:hypothetical protein [Candidatus Omnitrophota bacterium]